MQYILSKELVERYYITLSHKVLILYIWNYSMKIKIALFILAAIVGASVLGNGIEQAHAAWSWGMG